MTRVALLAPMQIELDPLVSRFALVPDGDVHRGRVGAVDVVAYRTDIGMANGARAARRAVAAGTDLVLVVGVAGGVAPDAEIGSVVVPATVVDRATGATFASSALPGMDAAGLISCGDDLTTDPAEFAALAAAGVVALDMETAAVAAVCAATATPWAAIRAISDRPADGLVDDALFAMTRPDGSADPDALARMLADPAARARLERLAHDAARAVEAAAATTASVVAALG